MASICWMTILIYTGIGWRVTLQGQITHFHLQCGTWHDAFVSFGQLIDQWPHYNCLNGSSKPGVVCAFLHHRNVICLDRFFRKMQAPADLVRVGVVSICVDCVHMSVCVCLVWAFTLVQTCSDMSLYTPKQRHRHTSACQLLQCTGSGNVCHKTALKTERKQVCLKCHFQIHSTDAGNMVRMIIWYDVSKTSHRMQTIPFLNTVATCCGRREWQSQQAAQRKPKFEERGTVLPEAEKSVVDYKDHIIKSSWTEFTQHY